MVGTGELLQDIFVSLQRALIGFFFGSLLGILLGIATGRNRIIDRSIGPLVQLLRPIPSIAIVPLAIVWFGLGEMSKYFLVFWGVFFPVWINTHIGASNVQKNFLWVARSLGAKGSRVLYEVIFPAAAPFIIAGMRTGIAIAFICLVAAEMAGAYGGVGYRVYVSHLVFRVDKMMVGIITLGLMGAVADMLFVGIVNWLLPWYRKNSDYA
jgi:NitT/TauT family transport system permease protein/sulfonate transport system permease protein